MGWIQQRGPRLRFTTQNRNNLLSPTRIWLKERKSGVVDTKNYLKRLSSMPWFIVSNAALRSRRVKIEMWSESLLAKRSLKTRRKAVSVLLCTVSWSIHRLKNVPQIAVWGVQAAWKGFFFSPAGFLMKIIPVVNWVCACVKTSVEDNSFLREGWEFYVLVWQRKHYSRKFWVYY